MLVYAVRSRLDPLLSVNPCVSAGDPAAGIGTEEEDDGGKEEEDEDGAWVAFLDDFFSFIQGNSAAKGPGCTGG